MQENTLGGRFVADGIIETLARHETLIGGGIKKSDIQASAAGLLDQIHAHPCYIVCSYLHSSPGTEKGKVPFDNNKRVAILNAYRGFSAHPSEMVECHNELMPIEIDLAKMKQEKHWITPQKALAERLLKNFHALEEIDRTYNRETLIEKFVERLGIDGHGMQELRELLWERRESVKSPAEAETPSRKWSGSTQNPPSDGVRRK